MAPASELDTSLAAGGSGAGRRAGSSTIATVTSCQALNRRVVSGGSMQPAPCHGISFV